MPPVPRRCSAAVFTGTALVGAGAGAGVEVCLLTAGTVYAGRTPVLVSGWFAATGLLLMLAAVPPAVLQRKGDATGPLLLALPARAWAAAFCGAVAAVAALAAVSSVGWVPVQTSLLSQRLQGTLATLPVALGVQPHFDLIAAVPIVGGAWAPALLATASLAYVRAVVRSVGDSARTQPQWPRQAAALTLSWAALSTLALVAALGYVQPAAVLPAQELDLANLLKQGYTLHWNTDRKPMVVHGITIVPTAVLVESEPIAVNEKWRALTLQKPFDQTPPVAVPHRAVNDPLRHAIRSHRRAVLYCRDAVVVTWSDSIECGASLGDSTRRLRKFVDGIALLGDFTRITIWQHWLLDGLPQLEESFYLASQFLRGQDPASSESEQEHTPAPATRVSLLCGPKMLCETAAAAQERALDRYDVSRSDIKLYPGDGIGRQGHHLQYLMWAFTIGGLNVQQLQAIAPSPPPPPPPQQQQEEQGRYQVDTSGMYPFGAYALSTVMFQPQHDGGGAMSTSELSHGRGSDEQGAESGGIETGVATGAETEQYVLFVSREENSRKMNQEARVEFIRRLETTLAQHRPRPIALKIFRHSRGQHADRALFHGALAVIGVHGGALCNTIFSNSRAVVIEILPAKGPRVLFASVACVSVCLAASHLLCVSFTCTAIHSA